MRVTAPRRVTGSRPLPLVVIAELAGFLLLVSAIALAEWAIVGVVDGLGRALGKLT